MENSLGNGQCIKHLSCTILLKFSHGNSILQILKTEASRGSITCQGNLFCKCKNWKSNQNILHLLKLLTLFAVGFGSWTFAMCYPNNGHKTEENPIKVNVQCCGLPRRKGLTLPEGNGENLSQMDFSKTMTFNQLFRMNGHGLGKKYQEGYFTKTEW